MNWITRERPRVGRIGCAWLIRRWIDPEAVFFFVPARLLASETARLGATPFHTEGAALHRQADVSSFEVVLRHYRLDADPALALLGRIVNTADIAQSPHSRPEGPGLWAILDGLLRLHSDDHILCAAGMQVYDALYAYCQEQVRLGRA